MLALKTTGLLPGGRQVVHHQTQVVHHGGYGYHGGGGYGMGGGMALGGGLAGAYMMGKMFDFD